MKILIADDHPVVRRGLRQLIDDMDLDSSIDETSNGDETLDQLEKNAYDLVIMDISMPGKSGLDILTLLKNKKMKSRVLVLSVHPQEQYALRVLKLGASGYVCKDGVCEELADAVKTILAGKKYISPALSQKMVFDTTNGITQAPHERLSPREFQVMCMMAQGKTVMEIAAELFISDKTVSTHRSRLLEKMDMKKNAEIICYALRNKLIE